MMNTRRLRTIPIHRLLHFSSPDAGELKWTRKKLPKSHPLYLPGSGCYILYGDWGCMIFQHIPGNYFDIWLSYYDVRKPCTFYVTGDIAVTECCFEIQNEKIHYIQPLAPVFCDGSSYNFYFFSAIDASIRFKGDKPVTTLDIHCHLPMLEKLRHGTLNKLDPLMGVIKAAESGKNKKAGEQEKIISERVFREPQQYTPVIKENLDRLIKLLHEQGVKADLRNLVYPLLHDCLTKKENEKIPAIAEGIPGVHELCRIMRATFPKRYTVEELARMACMTPRTFHRVFKNDTQTTPQKYYHNLAMETALHLVQNTALSFVQIAEDTGFSSKTAFTRAFIRRYKELPSKIRRKCQSR